jgi:hypothetical protein
MAKPRLYLFHGNDSRASSQELRRWVGAFLKKYGNATQQTFFADELSFEELIASIQQSLETQSLFPEPRFVVVRRLSSHSIDRVRKVLVLLGKQLQGLGEHITLVFWEDKMLPQSHALHTWFKEHEIAEKAEVKGYQVKGSRSLVDGIIERHNVRMDPDVAHWLDMYARRLEKEQRLAGKLRPNDDIPSDWRVWILDNLYIVATLLAGDEALKVQHLETASSVSSEPVSPFEIINAVQAYDWKRARKLARLWDQGDESAYFGFMALLRNYFRRPANNAQAELHEYALEMLGEIELISKNVTVRQAWLLELLFLRCSQFNGIHTPLLSARRLWLSHVQRVE